MIYITDKHKCCGCSACVQACPKGCILFNEDEEGFRYPLVDKTLCVDCGLCEKVCPCLNQSEQHQPLEVFAAINPNEEIRMQSSSGGIFTMLAEATINEGGVVFGARFDENWEVVHDYTETLEGLKDYRGSKYVQSRIDDNYVKVKSFLQEGRKVLFSGTPCQIAGLKLFLKRDYDNLLAVECVCHSVPSPGIWRTYISLFAKRNKHCVSDICNLNFRDKITGWEGYSVSVEFNDGKKYICNREKDLWMRGFICGLYCRPSCSSCPSKATTSKADITIGDLWGNRTLLPEQTDNKGICVVVVHNEKGMTIFKKLDIRVLKSYSLEDVSKTNPAICFPSKENTQSAVFNMQLKNDKNMLSVMNKMTKGPVKFGLRQLLSKIIRTFIPRR